MKAKRGQKWLCGIGTLVVCGMLTGCHMKHEWQQRVVRVYDPDFHMIELNKHTP